MTTTTKILKPSSFKGICPMNSVTQHIEDEQNMMWLLHFMATKYGNKWGLTWNQFKKLHPTTKWSQEHFKKFEGYIRSADTIRLFSKQYEL